MKRTRTLNLSPPSSGLVCSDRPSSSSSSQAELPVCLFLIVTVPASRILTTIVWDAKMKDEEMRAVRAQTSSFKLKARTLS